MIQLKTPRGILVDVPECADEDPSPKFNIEQAAEIRSYYDDNGYVIIRSGITKINCEEMSRLWNKEVKPSNQFIYRQATAKAERHSFNDQGWVMNPILNLQSVDPRKYPEFRNFATQHILTAPSLIKGFFILFGEQPKLVQSMYFEGNSATWEHQDSYYLDSEKVGSMAGAWIALEDISATAGRFFICPKSHRIDMGRQNSGTNIADNHEVYIQSVVKKIKEQNLAIRAPFLKQGDILLWNSWTIHGSLDSQDSKHSRSSITCHAIADSHRFLQLQTRILNLDIRIINGVKIHCPKDLRRFRNRMIYELETRHPATFYTLKKSAIRWLIRAKK